MATKLEKISRLALETSRSVTASPENWKSFLASAAWLYKYPFRDQILIHAQKPEATACAEIGLWNERLHRWVNRAGEAEHVPSYLGGTAKQLRWTGGHHGSDHRPVRDGHERGHGQFRGLSGGAASRPVRQFPGRSGGPGRHFPGDRGGFRGVYRAETAGL